MNDGNMVFKNKDGAVRLESYKGRGRPKKEDYRILKKQYTGTAVVHSVEDYEPQHEEYASD